MNKNNTETTVYQGIASRTGGDIYIGVVGPVRTGKSTFIKQFMESAVLPAIENDYDKQRARDELPQSASGKTVMTTEPKFVPDEAVSVSLSPGETVRVRMVDCVGYIVPEALGQEEDGAPRMVHTPWSEEPLPFKEAAELGTRKVIKEHSTVAMLVTQDGSFGEIPREAYVEAEEAVAKELEKAGTPFAVILNSAAPESREAVDLAYELEKKYNAPVALINCRLLDKEDVTHILELILGEFPVNELCFRLPPWCSALKPDHPLRQAVLSVVKDTADRIQKMGDVKKAADATPQTELLEGLTVANVYPESGKAVLEAHLVKGLAYRVLSEVTGYPIADETAMYALLQKLADTAHAYAHLKQALDEVEETGYGIVMPEAGELHLEEPKITKQAGGYGLKLKASAKSIHLIKAQIETELNPIVGTEEQSEEVLKNMMESLKDSPEKIWQSTMFGKSLYDLVGEGLRAKLAHIPEESRVKLSETLERIINEGSGGLICILL